MKKLLLCSFSFLLFNINYTQEKTKVVSKEKKTLTIEDGVLGYYKGLYPASLTGLSWTLNNQYVYQEKNEFIVLSPDQSYNSKKKRSITIESINAVNEKLELTTLPWGTKIDKEIISFEHMNSFYEIDLKNNTSKTIHYPNNA